MFSVRIKSRSGKRVAESVPLWLCLCVLKFKVEAGSLLLVHLIITFQHFAIQMVWKNTRLLHHCLALYSDRDAHFWPITGHFGEHVFLLAALRCASQQQVTLLLFCWNKWRVSRSKTDLWWLDKLRCRRHRQPAWIKVRRSSLHCCNFTCTRFVSSWIFGANWTKRENDNKNKTQDGAKTGRGECCGVASLGVSCYS